LKEVFFFIYSIDDETESPFKSIDSVPSKVEIAHKYIDFLKDSWANLADLEATVVPQARLLDQANKSYFDFTQSPTNN
jgi:hypothetical protein